MREYLEEIYFERYETALFNFGFEFEGIVNCETEDEWRHFANTYFRRKTQIIAKGGSTGDMADDSSLESDYGENTFEWKSPIFKVTPLAIQEVINFLYTAMRNYDVSTNESCGFHIHISFPEKKIVGPQIMWLLINLAFEEGDRTKNMLKKVLYYKQFRLETDDYANVDSLLSMQQRIREFAMWSDVQQEGFNKDRFIKIIHNFYNDQKFNLFRLHPQGTLEWRGPRNFLNTGNRKIIKGFFVEVLYPFVSWMANTLDKKFLEVGGIIISRNKLYKSLKKLKDPTEEQKMRKLTAPFHPMMPAELKRKVMKQFSWLRLNRAKYTGAFITISDGKPVFETGIWLSGIWKDGKFRGHWKNGVFENGSFTYTRSNFIAPGTHEYISRGYRAGFFEGGTVKNGYFNGVDFRNGVWENGTFKDGVWRNGIWKDGEIYNSEWDNGVFENGRFLYSTFSGGRWINGTFRNSSFRSGTWENGTFEGGSFHGSNWINGTFKEGNFYGGVWENGTFEDGTFNEGEWKDGVFENGTFSKDCVWRNGKFKGGNFEGEWYNGEWYNGEWHNGEWYGGFVIKPDGEKISGSAPDGSEVQKKPEIIIKEKVESYKNNTLLMKQMLAAGYELNEDEAKFEIIEGTERLCRTCDGEGTIAIYTKDEKTNKTTTDRIRCNVCLGTGVWTTSYIQLHMSCPICNGGDKNCPYCHGNNKVLAINCPRCGGIGEIYERDLKKDEELLGFRYGTPGFEWNIVACPRCEGKNYIPILNLKKSDQIIPNDTIKTELDKKPIPEELLKHSIGDTM